MIVTPVLIRLRENVPLFNRLLVINRNCLGNLNLSLRIEESQISLTAVHSATLTPMHLRKAKLMFFWVRYPSSAVLKMYFPDIRFNKNNTAQLVKWFSNFR